MNTVQKNMLKYEVVLGTYKDNGFLLYMRYGDYHRIGKPALIFDREDVYYYVYGIEQKVC